MKKDIKSKIIESSIVDEKWIDRAKERQQNKGWRRISAKIAVKILRHLRTNKISQKTAAEQIGYSPQYLNKVLKGRENLTLETIYKIQTALNLVLIEIPALESPIIEHSNCESKATLVYFD